MDIDSYHMENSRNVNELTKIDPLLVTAYDLMMMQYPVLDGKIDINKSDPANIALRTLIYKPNGAFVPSFLPKRKSSILLNLTDNDTKPYKRALGTCFPSFEIMAQRLGLDPEIFVKNTRLVNLFMFCHEIGHAEMLYSQLGENESPYVSQVPIRSKEKLFYNLKRWRGVWEALKEAQSRSIYRLLLGNLVFIYDIYRLNQIMNRVTHEEYRSMPMEQYADEFAADFIRRNWEVLGMDKVTGISEPPTLNVEPLFYRKD